jgi:hypothetical protein
MAKGTVLSYLEEYPLTSNRLKLVSEESKDILSGQNVLTSTRCEKLVGIAKGLSYLHHQKPVIVHGDLRAVRIINGISTDSNVFANKECLRIGKCSSLRGWNPISE